MKSAAEIVKNLRAATGLSQRDFARRSSISFRQLQRVESGLSDMTWQSLQAVTKTWNLELGVAPSEPDWNCLTYFGLAIHDENTAPMRSSLPQFFENLQRAIIFLNFQRTEPAFHRHRDALKGLLLSLWTHYPSIFNAFQKKYGLPIAKLFRFDLILGRHIKLRNISLELFAPRVRRYLMRH